MRKYIDHFFSLKCGPDILPFFNNNHRSAGKEITESFAMWRAAIDVLEVDPKEPLIAIVVGDGKRPRTASVLAHLTQWNTISIDPILDMKWFNTYAKERDAQGNPLVRLRPIPRKAHKEEITVNCKGWRAILFFPHAHAPMSEALQVPTNYSRLDVINMPCCNKIEPQFLMKKFALQHQLFTFVDDAVWSPKNTIHVWQNL